MPVLVTCPQCQRKLKIGDDTIGKRIKCSDCGAIFAARASAPAAIGSRPRAIERPAAKPQARAPAGKTSTSEADEKSDRPTRSAPRPRGKKKSNAGLYVVLGVLLSVFVVIGLVVGGIVWLANRAKNAADEMVYTPPLSMPQGGGPNTPPPQSTPPPGQQPQPQPVPPAGAPKSGIGSKVLAGFDWKPFKDPNGRYTVLMPKLPREDRPNYFTVTALEYGGLNEGIYSYNFSILYDKRENENRPLEEQIKDWREANTELQLKPLKDQSIQVKGHSGWEIMYKETEKKEYIRRWFVKLKQGVAMVSVNVPDTPDWIAAADKFFASFTPLDAPGEASAATPNRDFRASIEELWRQGNYEEVRKLAQQAMTENAGTDDELFYRDKLVLALDMLNRRGEATALLQAAYDKEKAKGKSARLARALTDLYDQYVQYEIQKRFGWERAVMSAEEATKAKQLLDLILTSAIDDPRPEWAKWAASKGIHSIVSSYTKDAHGRPQQWLTPPQRIAYIRQLLVAVPDNPRLAFFGHANLAPLLERENQAEEALAWYEQLVKDWAKAPVWDRFPCQSDRQYTENSSNLERVLHAQKQRGALLAVTDARSKQAAEQYRSLLQDYGFGNRQSVQACQFLTLDGVRSISPKKGALIVGGATNAHVGWSRFLKPQGFTVHPFLLPRIRLPDLASYELVVLAHQGSRALEPQEVLALRSYVATGGSLLVITSTGWEVEQPQIYNSLLSFFGLHARLGGSLWRDSTETTQHPVAQGISAARAKHAAVLDGPPESVVVKSEQGPILVAMPYRKGRVVAASFGQWLVPDTDWLGDDWSELIYEDYYQRPIDQLPLERGEKLEQPLLKNVIAWLMEDRAGRRSPALTAALRKALFADRLLLPPDTVKKELDKLIAKAGKGEEREETLWAAGEVMNNLPANPDSRVLREEWKSRGGPPLPLPRYYEQLIQSYPDSPLRPFARWRLVECHRVKKVLDALGSSNETYVRIAPANLTSLYEQVDAPRASYAWAWTQLRLGQMYLYENKPEEALACYQAVNEAIPPGPEHMLALIGAGLCCEKLHRADEAKKHYQTILQLPDIVWYPSNDLIAWGPLGDTGKGYWFNSIHLTARHLLQGLERQGGR